MKHYQENYKCMICGKEFIVDIFSWGVMHQEIKAVTCKECAINILDKPEEIKFEDAK